jgi:hypothetical protein
MLKGIWADPLPNISIMPFIAWNSKNYIHYYTKNEYILNEMKRIQKSKLDE